SRRARPAPERTDPGPGRREGLPKSRGLSVGGWPGGLDRPRRLAGWDLGPRASGPAPVACSRGAATGVPPAGLARYPRRCSATVALLSFGRATGRFGLLDSQLEVSSRVRGVHLLLDCQLDLALHHVAYDLIQRRSQAQSWLPLVSFTFCSASPACGWTRRR